MHVTVVTFDVSDTWSLRVLAGKVSQAGGHTLVEQRTQEQHLPVRGAGAFEVAHWCFKEKFMVQGAASDILL